MKFLIEIDDEELHGNILADDEDIETKEDITEENIYCYVSSLIGVNHSNYEVEIVEN